MCIRDRYRTCEAVGVEASAEIQAAARRVLEENRRLRQLLRQQGFSDAQIDAASGNAGLKDEEEEPAPPAQALRVMLQVKRACGTEEGCASRQDVRDIGDSADDPRWMQPMEELDSKTTISPSTSAQTHTTSTT